MRIIFTVKPPSTLLDRVARASYPGAAAYGRAQQLMKAGFYAAALRVLCTLVPLRPSKARSLRPLGFAYQHGKQQGKAYEAFCRVVQMSYRPRRCRSSTCALCSGKCWDGAGQGGCVPPLRQFGY